jgi:hypothetical protein
VLNVRPISARILAIGLALSINTFAKTHDCKQAKDQALLTKEGVITHWKDFSVVRADNQLFLVAASGQRTHLYTDKKQHCSVTASFLNEDHIYIETCSRGAFVADLGGAVRYKMPSFKYWDVVSDKLGTRFAVFERGRSPWHEFGQETYDKLRLLVYSTADGKKLFERRWKQSADEVVGQEKIELSDDGSTLFLHSQKGTQTFFVREPH